jgi:hypothetical protein
VYLHAPLGDGRDSNPNAPATDTNAIDGNADNTKNDESPETDLSKSINTRRTVSSVPNAPSVENKKSQDALMTLKKSWETRKQAFIAFKHKFSTTGFSVQKWSNKGTNSLPSPRILYACDEECRRVSLDLHQYQLSIIYFCLTRFNSLIVDCMERTRIRIR